MGGLGAVSRGELARAQDAPFVKAPEILRGNIGVRGIEFRVIGNKQVIGADVALDGRRFTPRPRGEPVGE